jgi:hypothetical protein
MRAGDVEVGAADDGFAVGRTAPGQAARIDGECDAPAVIAQVGGAARDDAAFHQVQVQGIELQHLVLEPDPRGAQDGGETAALQAAVHARVAAGTVGGQVEAQRFAGRGAGVGEQADVQCLGFGLQLPARLLPALQPQRGAQGAGRVAGERDPQVRQVAARHQAQPRGGAPGSRRQHGADGQVGAVVVARHVHAVEGEVAAVAAHGHFVQLQAAARGAQAACSWTK